MSALRLQMQARRGRPLSPAETRAVIYLLDRCCLKRWSRQHGRDFPHTRKPFVPADVAQKEELAV